MSCCRKSGGNGCAFFIFHFPHSHSANEPRPCNSKQRVLRIRGLLPAPIDPSQAPAHSIRRAARPGNVTHPAGQSREKLSLCEQRVCGIRPHGVRGVDRVVSGLSAAFARVGSCSHLFVDTCLCRCHAHFSLNSRPCTHGTFPCSLSMLACLQSYLARESELSEVAHSH